MPITTSSPLNRLQELKDEIANLEKAAIQELTERRNNIRQELASVDAEIAKLRGKSSPVKTGAGRFVTLLHLKELLTS